ncbi:MAG: F0F1 ATP synthase subunit delta [Patescibacteria group bacterium]|nr:F0F1 ATP synthase subunit delta [Patescibacteria group bacterium]
MITFDPANAIDRLFSLLVTRDDVVLMSQQLSEIISSVFSRKEDFGAILSRHLSREKKEIILALLDQDQIEYTDVARVQRYLVALREAIAALPVLELQIAVEPSDNLMSMVEDWVEQNTNEKVILDVRVVPELIGGAVISWKGKIQQNSLLHILKEESVRQNKLPGSLQADGHSVSALQEASEPPQQTPPVPTAPPQQTVATSPAPGRVAVPSPSQLPVAQ